MNNDYHILPETIKQKLMQLTDTEFATWINRAAPTTFYHGARMYAGNPDAPRRNLVQHAIWGQFKSDEQLDHLTSSILEAFPPSAATPACLISTLSTTHDLGQEFETDEAANLRQWSRRGAPSITPPQIRSNPLDSGIAIFQIFEHAHFTNLITDGETSYIYDSLGNYSTRNTCFTLLNRLSNFYENHRPNIQPPPLIAVEEVSGPAQRDFWSCGMFMVATSLSSIYQHSAQPELRFTQAHAYQLHRASLTYLLTGEFIPWITHFIRYLQNPQTEDYRIAAEPPNNPNACR